MSDRNSIPCDVLELMHSLLTPVREFSVEDLEKYASGGHGPAFAYLGFRHSCAIGFPISDHQRGRNYYLAAIECDDCFEGWGCMLCFNYGTQENVVIDRLGLKPIEVATKLEEKGLWDMLKNDETNHAASMFTMIAVGFGYLKIPPHVAKDIIPSITRRHEAFIETRTESLWFNGFSLVIEAVLTCLGNSSCEPEEAVDFKQLDAVCRRFGVLFGKSLLCAVATGLGVGRPGYQHVGKLSTDTMNKLALLIYRYLIEEFELANATFQMGLSFCVGSLGQNQDFFKAFSYFERSVKQNHTSSLFSLAAFYQTGIGGVVEPDLKYAETLRARMDHNCIIRLGFFVPASLDTPELFDAAGQQAVAEASAAAHQGASEAFAQQMPEAPEQFPLFGERADGASAGPTPGR
jgi:hypothetical protein